MNYTFWNSPTSFDWVLAALPFILGAYFAWTLVQDHRKKKKEVKGTMLKKLEVAATAWVANPTAENEQRLNETLEEIDG